MTDGVTLENRKYETRNPIKKFLVGNFSKKLAELFYFTNPKTVADIGCGTGYIFKRIVEGACPGLGDIEFYMCDIDQKAVESARLTIPLQRAHFSVQDISDLAYRDRAFDLVICCEVLEHIDSPEEAIKKIRSISKKWFIFSVPNEPWFSAGNLLFGKNLAFLGSAPGHVSRWSTASFVDMLKKYFIVHKVMRPFPWSLVLCSARG